MAVTRQTLTFISISVLLFYALCPRATSAPSPSPTPMAAAAAAPLYELFEFKLPNIVGLQKTTVEPQPKNSNVVAKQLQAVEHRIDEFKAILKKRLADPATSESTQMCIAQCEDNFADAIDDVKESIESINNQNLSKANFDVSAVSTDVDTCNDCFKEMVGEDLQIKTFDDWVRGVTGDCLDNLQKTSN